MLEGVDRSRGWARMIRPAQASLPSRAGRTRWIHRQVGRGEPAQIACALGKDRSSIHQRT